MTGPTPESGDPVGVASGSNPPSVPNWSDTLACVHVAQSSLFPYASKTSAVTDGLSAVSTTPSLTLEIVSAAGSPGQTSNAALVTLRAPDVTVSAVCSSATAVVVNDEMPFEKSTACVPVSPVP